MARVESISAVTFAVTDMARSVVFYDTLGFERLYGGGAEPFTSYRVGEGFVNLQLDTSWAPGPVVWGRTVFWVDDVDDMYRQALAAGLTPSMPPSDAAWGERYFHLRDPDGHELSFARPIEPG